MGPQMMHIYSLHSGDSRSDHLMPHAHTYRCHSHVNMYDWAAWLNALCSSIPPSVCVCVCALSGLPVFVCDYVTLFLLCLWMHRYFFLSHTLIRTITLACSKKKGMKKHPQKVSLSFFLVVPVSLSLSLVSQCTFLSRISIIHQEYAYFIGFLRYIRDTLHMYSTGVPVLLLGEAPLKGKHAGSPRPHIRQQA